MNSRNKIFARWLATTTLATLISLTATAGNAPSEVANEIAQQDGSQMAEIESAQSAPLDSDSIERIYKSFKRDWLALNDLYNQALAMEDQVTRGYTHVEMFIPSETENRLWLQMPPELKRETVHRQSELGEKISPAFGAMVKFSLDVQTRDQLSGKIKVIHGAAKGAEECLSGLSRELKFFNHAVMRKMSARDISEWAERADWALRQNSRIQFENYLDIYDSETEINARAMVAALGGGLVSLATMNPLPFVVGAGAGYVAQGAGVDIRAAGDLLTEATTRANAHLAAHMAALLDLNNRVKRFGH